jgi:hypothetical protein
MATCRVSTPKGLNDTILRAKAFLGKMYIGVLFYAYCYSRTTLEISKGMLANEINFTFGH